MLLSACAGRTDTTATRVIFRLPPAGMIVPCDKPSVIGTWPAVVTTDIPKLKHALGACAQQAEDYLSWRTAHEQLAHEQLAHEQSAHEQSAVATSENETTESEKP
jgi:hypothetical protein